MAIVQYSDKAIDLYSNIAEVLLRNMAITL